MSANKIESQVHLERLKLVLYNTGMSESSTELIFEPQVVSLPKEFDPLFAFQRLRSLPYCCWLDSALVGPPRGRYSFLCCDPIDVLEVQNPTADPLAKLEGWLSKLHSRAKAELPPFQGGIAGYMGYEFGRCFERIPRARHDEFSLPIAVLGLYDVVLCWDHERELGWLISQGFAPDLGNESIEIRRIRAEERADYFMRRLHQPALDACSSTNEPSARSVHAMAHGLTAPQFETRLGGGWLGNFDSDGYRAAVQKARDYIYAGDIFQVNLSQRLLCPARCSSPELYEKLRIVNAAPFAGYFDFGVGQIISASPERFVQIENQWIETRPIKGTRRRTGDVAADGLLAEELQTSQKDRAENIMIVDLLRNDLSKVCRWDSMRVDQLCAIEEYPFVLHMVSSIRGQLRNEATVSDLFSSIFPGGSITGAPKVRAMEIIAELEPTVRGPYCGSLGYCSVDGSMDWNILIRTLTASRGWWQFQVGGGIVADSNPAQEEEETWTKAAGLIAAIESTLALKASS